jgi:hypothetical protein
LAKVHGKELMIFNDDNNTFFVVDQGYVRQGNFSDKSTSKESSGYYFNKVAFDAILDEYSK